MSVYLVTGAAGFIGARLCEKLLAQGHRVVGIDNLNSYYDVRMKDYRLSKLLGCSNWAVGCSPMISDFAPGFHSELKYPLEAGYFTFYPIDVEDRGALERLFRDITFDAVFNLAARAGVRYSVVNPDIYLTTNVHGVLNVLECMRQTGVAKLVLASTSSLYTDGEAPFTEKQTANSPRSPYAASKKAAEMFAYAYHTMYGIDVSVLRYFTVFGPAGRPDMALFRFIKSVDEGIPITLYGDGTQARDFTYVDDIVHGTFLAVKSIGYEVINLGGGRDPLRLIDVIQIIEDGLGKKARIIEEPHNAADAFSTQANIEKAKQMLGWEPEVTPREGFARALKWHLQNREWLKNIQL